MDLAAAQAQVVDDAAAQPLVGPDAQDVVAAGVEVRLESGQQAARQEVAVAAVTVARLLLAPDELLGPTHVQVLARAQVTHQLRQTLRLHRTTTTDAALSTLIICRVKTFLGLFKTKND